MDPHSLVPTPDTIPAPAWVFWILGLVMFSVHILLINALLGSSIIIAATRLFKGGGPAEVDLAGNLAVKTMALFSFGINLGVAALLFLQVIYGHFMYASSVLMAVYWILVIPLLIVAYYGGYVYIRRKDSAPALATVSIVVTTLILLYVGFAFVSNMSLMAAPERWTAYFDDRGGTLLNVADPTFWPRYLHFVVASVAVGGLFMALINERRAEKGGADIDGPPRGLRVFAVATCVQGAVGIWYLLSLPREIMMAFMGGRIVSTVALVLGLLLFVGAVAMAFLGKTRATLYHLVPLVLVMAVHRANLRSLYLEEHFSLSSLELAPQYDVLALFLAVLGLGVWAVIHMVRLVLRAREEKVAS